MSLVVSPWLLTVTIPMLLGDLLSIYIVAVENPFIFFESKLLEGFFLAINLTFDVIYDFMWMALWAVSSAKDDENIWLDTFALISAFIFFADLYQVDTFLLEYGLATEVSAEESKIESEISDEF